MEDVSFRRSSEIRHGAAFLAGGLTMSLKGLKGWAFVCALSISPAAVYADQISFSDAAPLMLTNWNQTIALPKFDPSLGTLTSVLLKLTGEVNGSASLESTNPLPTNVTTIFNAEITLMRPDNSILLTASPKSSITVSVGGFDGTIDFMGPSGRMIPEVKDSAMTTVQFDQPFSMSDQTLFIGAGDFLNLPVRAVGRSRGSGSGNLLMLFRTSAAASAEITYTFTPIPEPATALTLLLGATMLNRRNRSLHGVASIRQ